MHKMSISNLIPATSLKIVGRGHVYHAVASPLLLKTFEDVWHRGNEFLELWCWNLVPFLPDIGFQLLKSSWPSLMYFSFNDVQNVLNRWKIWTPGRPIQHPDPSTIKSCCCNSCSVWFCIVLLKYTRLEGSICCSKTFIYFSIHSAFQNMQAAHTVCTYAPHTIKDAGCWTERGEHAGRSPSSLAWRTQHPWFRTRMSNLDLSDHRTLLYFEKVHYKWALVHRTQWRFWTMFTYGFLFAW